MSRKKTQVEEFDADRVRPLKGQPRKRFFGIRDLADSILEVGQSTPGIVTLVNDDPKYDAQLVDGERRLRACKLADVPFRAEIRPDGNAEDIFVASFAANFGKQDHDVLEIAEGLARMHRNGKTVEQLAKIAGKSVCWVIQYMHLLKLHPEVQAMLVSEKEDESPRLAFTVAQTLVQVPQDRQLKLARKITKGDGMKLSAARRFVLKERADAGDERAYTKNNGSKRSILTLETFMEDISNRIGVYLDMPGAEIVSLIDAIDHRAKRQLAESLEETASDLEALADTIKRRLPVASKRAS